MTKIPFIKMHGIGNDFVIIAERAGKYAITTKMVQFISDRHKGVGCDQFVVIGPAKEADCSVSFYNPDGCKSGACGNATRCVASQVMLETGQEVVTLETDGGLLECRKNGDEISVNMGKAKTNWQEIPLAHEVDTLNVPLSEGDLKNPVAVSMGNPHAVFFVNDVAAIDLENLGPKLENNEIFPQRANIGVAQIISENAINLRVWERGAGETLACGSGACAAVFASYSRGFTENNVIVNLPGGKLRIEILESNEVIMTGSATKVFEGVVDFEASL